MAKQLNLDEKLPFAERDLLEQYVTPPLLAKRLGAMGNVTTDKYTYFVSVDSKFSFLVKRNLEQDYQTLRERYLWPDTRKDTNAAFSCATQLLSAVSIDVDALNRDCDVHVLPFTPGGKSSSYFVPVYWVYWTIRDRRTGRSAAFVELFEPQKSVRQMYVNDSKYILRKPIKVENSDFLKRRPSQSTNPAGSEKLAQ